MTKFPKCKHCGHGKTSHVERTNLEGEKIYLQCNTCQEKGIHTTHWYEPEEFPRKLFNKIMEIASEFQTVKREFDDEIKKIYKTHYSDHDDDWIIDAIDYGGGGLTYEDFCKRMERHRKEYEYANEDW